MSNDATPDPPALRFCLLGPVRAWRGTTEVPLGSPQQRTTLAVLLLHEGTAVTIEQLTTALWGSDKPRAAVSTVRTYVSRLRRLLGSDTTIRSTAGGYALSVPESALDLMRLRRHLALAAASTRAQDPHATAVHLRAALELRHGRPLAGADGPYAENQRIRLEQMLCTVALDLMSVEVSRGRHREALPELTAMVEEHPLWDRVHELYMTALHHSGRQADALTHYQATRRRMVEELGIEPGTRLQELHQRIRAGTATDGMPARTHRHPARSARLHHVRARRQASRARHAAAYDA
jgi:DNA-binding SARP family transcriptional activator